MSSFQDSLTTCLQSKNVPIYGMVDFNFVEKSYEKHFKEYQSWIAQGHHGVMEYLKRGEERRSEVKKIFTDTKSVIAIGIPYSTKPIAGDGVRYARYLRGYQGKDYHVSIKNLLKSIFSELEEEFSNLEYKICVDTSAVLERSWGYFCGLGWIGKSKMLIHPKFGSYFFIGIVLTNQSIEQNPKPFPSYCGRCTRCLKSCPTEAFEASGKLNAKKCISYWTLEKRVDREDETSFPAEKIKPWVAGCDICQEVCPFNFKRVKAEFFNKIGTPKELIVNLDLLQNENLENYRARVRNSALSRVKADMFRRNLKYLL